MIARHWKLLAFIVVVAGGAWTAVRAAMDTGPALATAEVTRGPYVDIIEVRGEVRPVRSIVVAAPADAGELVILTLAKNGADVKKGDVVAQFDAITLRRTVQERQSEMRQAMAELNQTGAQGKIAAEQLATAVMRATYDVQRAELGVVDTELVSQVEAERAKLALDDAKHRLAEAKAAATAGASGAAADLRGRQRRIDKVQADLDRANRALGALEMIAPADGTVNILPNYRSSTPMGGATEFRPGDRTFPMAQILELPDLTSVHLTARIDEADRGQLKPGLVATIRADAVPDREYTATITDVSVLARVDFNSGWPPAKMFDLKLTFKDVDSRLRPGMSAVARIPVGQLNDVLLVPAEAVFAEGGRPVVYVARGRTYVATEVQVIRRGRTQVALSGGVSPGDRITLVSPAAAAGAASGAATGAPAPPASGARAPLPSGASR